MNGIRLDVFGLKRSCVTLLFPLDTIHFGGIDFGRHRAHSHFFSPKLVCVRVCLSRAKICAFRAGSVCHPNEHRHMHDDWNVINESNSGDTGDGGRGSENFAASAALSNNYCRQYVSPALRCLMHKHIRAFENIHSVWMVFSLSVFEKAAQMPRRNCIWNSVRRQIEMRYRH